jgi:hypothetical protein
MFEKNCGKSIIIAFAYRLIGDTVILFVFTQPPQPPQPWQDVFNATQLSNACIQDAKHLTDMHPGWNKFSEDCLNLNIFAPQVSRCQ